MARTFTYPFGTGATLVLLSLAAPDSPGRDKRPLLRSLRGSLGRVRVAWDRLPLWAFEASPLAAPWW